MPEEPLGPVASLHKVTDDEALAPANATQFLVKGAGRLVLA